MRSVVYARSDSFGRSAEAEPMTIWVAALVALGYDYWRV